MPHMFKLNYFSLSRLKLFSSTMMVVAHVRQSPYKETIFIIIHFYPLLDRNWEDNLSGHMMQFIIVYHKCPPPKSRSDKLVLTCRVLYHSHWSSLMFMMIHACGYFLFLIITLTLQAITYEVLPSLGCKRLPVDMSWEKPTDLLFLCQDQIQTRESSANSSDTVQ